MFTDIAGYTESMSKDEAVSTSLLNKKESIFNILIKKAENIEFELNLRLYELLDDKSYLETAYNQVQEKASAMDDAAKFLSYPIPKAIVEEWEKVKWFAG